MNTVLKIFAFCILAGTAIFGYNFYREQFPEDADFSQNEHFSLQLNPATLQNRLTETPDFTFSAVTDNNYIGWEKFPVFHLPSQFKFVFHGARMENDNLDQILSRGFTHVDISRMSDQEKTKSRVSQRAIMMGANYFTQFNAMFSNAPLGVMDPFAETDQKFQNYVAQLQGICFNHYHDCAEGSVMRATVDLFVWDLENVLYKPEKKYLSPGSPGRSIPDDKFDIAYFNEMAKKYRLLVETTKQNVVAGAKVGTYNPGCPIEMGNFNLENYKNPSAKMWMWDWPAGADKKNYRDFVDFQTPGGYFLTNNLENRDGIYQIMADQEVNAHWSSIPRIPVEWMFTTNLPNAPVPPKLAEATSIFTVMSGAQGSWFWDEVFKMTKNQSTLQNPRQRNYACYEYYIAGLYRLSKHNDFLQTNYQAVIPEVSFDGGKSFSQLNAAELRQKSLPLVRALVSKGRILLAAQNPKATGADQKVTLVVKYGNWKDVITLKGENVYLGEARM